jgi:hypothetical protein
MEFYGQWAYMKTWDGATPYTVRHRAHDPHCRSTAGCSNLMDRSILRCNTWYVSR